MNKYLNIDWLRENHTLIHYFGLGFIQIKLDDGTRVHVYTESLPAVTHNEEIHNHRYYFVSNILAGKFSQSIYDLQYHPEEYTHIKRFESCTPGTSAPDDIDTCLTHLVYRKDYFAGDSYFMDKDTFHTVEAQEAITHLRRGPVVKQFAQVVTPKDLESICPFSVTQPEGDLFEIVESVILRLSSK